MAETFPSVGSSTTLPPDLSGSSARSSRITLVPPVLISQRQETALPAVFVPRVRPSFLKLSSSVW
jgi:hypothetical protein